MKIALCFHGLPRLIEKCYTDIYNYFIKNNNIDIFAHFYWDESYKGKVNRLHMNERFDINENPIKIFENLYNPKKIIYENCPNDYDGSDFKIQGHNANDIKNDILYSKIMASFAIYCFYCRFYSIKKCLNLIDNINEYDLVIIIRTDLLTFNKQINLLSEINNLDFTKNIYFPSSKEGGPKYAGEFPNELCDWLFIGVPKNIINYTDKIYDIFNNNNNYNFISPIHNKRFYCWAQAASISIDIYNSNISIRRYILEEYEDDKYCINNKINPEFYLDNFDKINNKFNHNDLLPFYYDNIKYIK